MPEPQGNIATESAATEQRLDTSQRRTNLVFAALGMLTGLLSYLSKYATFGFLHFSFFPHAEYQGTASILPGVIFGVLVVGCCHRFGTRHRLLLLLAVLITTAAWILAFDLTSQAERTLGNELPRDLRGTLSFAIGGLVGGLGTCLAVAIANPRFRRWEGWLLTLLIATLLGAVESIYDRMGEAGLLALFVVWQAAVIASIARALGRGGLGPGTSRTTPLTG